MNVRTSKRDLPNCLDTTDLGRHKVNAGVFLVRYALQQVPSWRMLADVMCWEARTFVSPMHILTWQQIVAMRLQCHAMSMPCERMRP
jgi:hypothetical protein